MGNWTKRKAVFYFREELPYEAGQRGPPRPCTWTAAVGAGWVSTLQELAHSALPGAGREVGDNRDRPLCRLTARGGWPAPSQGLGLHPAWRGPAPLPGEPGPGYAAPPAEEASVPFSIRTRGGRGRGRKHPGRGSL